VALVDDDRRHRLDARHLPAALGRTHLAGVVVAGQDGAGALGVQPHLRHHGQQHLVMVHPLAAAVVGLQQRALERQLPVGTLQPSPVQQPVRLEGVDDAPAPCRVEGKAHRRAALVEGGQDLVAVGRHPAPLAAQVLVHVHALGAHVGVELEGLQVQRGRHRIRTARQRLLQRGQAHRAPGAGHVGDEIDSERGWHGQGSAAATVNILPAKAPHPWTSAAPRVLPSPGRRWRACAPCRETHCAGRGRARSAFFHLVV
jgi:hypothetical protein